jgi:hypothetical protein
MRDLEHSMGNLQPRMANLQIVWLIWVLVVLIALQTSLETSGTALS